MSARWKAFVTLVGAKLPETTIRYDLVVDELGLIGDQFDEAQIALSSLVNALENVSDANVTRASITYDQTQSGTLGAGDVTDEAVIQTFLNGAGQKPKYYDLRIPAPKAALFLAGDANRVDESNLDLIDYVSNVSTFALVSDGETINTAIQNGISEGYWRSKARTVK